jgi:hypothetical protein
MREPLPAGWAWLEAQAGDADDDRELARAFARCFSGSEGALALAHLRRVFLDRRLPPSASDAELRHLEGQRSVVAHVAALIERGRHGPPLPASK